MSVLRYRLVSSLSLSNMFEQYLVSKVYSTLPKLDMLASGRFAIIGPSYHSILSHATIIAAHRVAGLIFIAWFSDFHKITHHKFVSFVSKLYRKAK